MVRIQEHLSRNLSATKESQVIEWALKQVSARELSGLKLILLRDSTLASTSEQKRLTRGGKRPAGVVKGLYRPYKSKRGGEIHVFLDVLEKEWPSILWKIPIIRTSSILKVFFHELGHHIALNQFKGKGEAVAISLGTERYRAAMKKRYFYLRPAAWIMSLVQSRKSDLF